MLFIASAGGMSRGWNRRVRHVPGDLRVNAYLFGCPLDCAERVGIALAWPISQLSPPHPERGRPNH